MNIHFKKYQCLGRDFILIDNRDGSLSEFRPTEWGRMCERKFGIGASGILRIEAVSQDLVEVTAFNSNGFLAELNLIDAACVAVFVRDLGVSEDTLNVRINKQTVICKRGSNHETMHFVSVLISETIAIKKLFQNFVMEFGTTFCMVPTDNVGILNIEEKGREVSRNKRFPKGTNVVFYQPHESFLEVRHYEYQTDEETFINGLCVVGAALSHAQNNPNTKSFIRTKGGELQVSFDYMENEFHHVELQVLVNEVYSGVYKFNKQY